MPFLTIVSDAATSISYLWQTDISQIRKDLLADNQKFGQELYQLLGGESRTIIQREMKIKKIMVCEGTVAVVH